jgi:hypothetical protein
LGVRWAALRSAFASSSAQRSRSHWRARVW